MDMNYILGREQTSLHNAQAAKSSCARIVHQRLAAAYGKLLADSSFPHRSSLTFRFRPASGNETARWGEDGGQAS